MADPRLPTVDEGAEVNRRGAVAIIIVGVIFGAMLIGSIWRAHEDNKEVGERSHTG